MLTDSDSNNPAEPVEFRFRHYAFTDDPAGIRHVAGRFGHDMEGALRIAGTVVRGETQSAKIGFPTANLRVPPSVVLPPDGVYAGWLRHSGGAGLPSVIYVGKRPVLRGQARRYSIEVHVIDWSGSLLRKKVCIQFFACLRDELQFKSADLLARQMKKDCAAARALLGSGL